MLRSDMPFGSWRESELEPVTKIAKGHIVMPSTFSAEVVDLITKVIPIPDNCNSTFFFAVAIQLFQISYDSTKFLLSS
jgi:protein kinase X